MNNTRNVRVLLATGIFPPDIGGPATYANVLREELPKRGFDVKIVTYSEAGDSRKITDGSIFKINRSENILLRYFKFFFAVWRLSKTVDVVYGFDLISTGLPCVIVKIFRPCLKYVIRIGGDRQWEEAIQSRRAFCSLAQYYREKKFNIKERVFFYLAKFVLRRVDRVLFNAQIIADVYVDYFGVDSGKLENIKNIRPEIDLTKFENQSTGDIVKILYAGRLVGFKNLLALLQAVQQVKSEKKFMLEIIGFGPEKEVLVNFVKENGLDGLVKISAGLPRSEAIKKMSECNVFVIPSLTEVNSNDFAEVRVFGKVVVLSKYSEAYLQKDDYENLIYIDPFDVDDIARAIERAISMASCKQVAVGDSVATVSLNEALNKLEEIFKGI